MKTKAESKIRLTLLIMIGLGIIGIILTLAMKGAGAGPAPGKPSGIKAGTGSVRVETLPVKTVKAFTGDINRVIRINGSISAEESVILYPEVSGKLVRNTVSVGDRVKSGQTVAWIDPSKPGDVYSSSAVNSTISGTVTDIFWNKGDTVKTTDPVITIGKLDTLIIETGIPERYANRVYSGQTAHIALEAFPGESFNAVISEISPVLDPDSRTLGIKLRITSSDKRIKSGMFAAVSLAVETSKKTLLVPSSALSVHGGETTLFTVEGGKAVLHTVKTGISDGDRTEILSGLSAGDEVVIEGNGVLSDGNAVSIQ